jgi:hypothetical protein
MTCVVALAAFASGFGLALFMCDCQKPATTIINVFIRLVNRRR